MVGAFRGESLFLYFIRQPGPPWPMLYLLPGVKIGALSGLLMSPVEALYLHLELLDPFSKGPQRRGKGGKLCGDAVPLRLRLAKRLCLSTGQVAQLRRLFQ